MLFRGKRRYCPVCESSLSFFKPYGHVKRKDAQCPVCGAVERHRFTWHYFQSRTDLFDDRPKRMLHVGPEPAFEAIFRTMPQLDYATLDLQDPNADYQMDLTALEFDTDSFDIVHCSHVLEHIQEDEKAMRELSRVLRPTGWATILVPVIAETTFDDPSVTEPAERAKLFGQWDHVRAYGEDFADRLAAQGFDVRTVRAPELVTGEQEQRMRFKDEQLFLCRVK